jgi:single-strand DNA-binding protein
MRCLWTSSVGCKVANPCLRRYAVMEHSLNEKVRIRIFIRPAGDSPMSGSVNKVILVGNLGRDPEFTATKDGRRFGRLSIATSERWRDRGSGERREQTEWHRVVIFNDNLVDVAERFLKKGSKVYLEGQLQTRKWQDQSGQDRYSTEVVLGRFRGELTMLDSRSEGGGEFGGGDQSGGDYGGGDQSSSDQGGNYGGGGRSSGGGQRDSGSSTVSSAGASRAAPMDLDDDIPF